MLFFWIKMYFLSPSWRNTLDNKWYSRKTLTNPGVYQNLPTRRCRIGTTGSFKFYVKIKLAWKHFYNFLAFLEWSPMRSLASRTPLVCLASLVALCMLFHACYYMINRSLFSVFWILYSFRIHCQYERRFDLENGL